MTTSPSGGSPNPNVQLVPLSQLREEQVRLPGNAFVYEYPGVFFLAMGGVSAEVISAKINRAAAEKDGERTTAVSFRGRMKHDSLVPHPLAGKAFFVRVGGEPFALLMGRHETCDLTVPQDTVSERHCRLEIAADGVGVVDLESTNGTAINLKRLTPNQSAPLDDEEILTVGRYSFQFFSPQTMYTELGILSRGAS